MRHGYLSDTQGKNQAQPAARGITAEEVTKCPFGHYSSLFGDAEAATQRAIVTLAKSPSPEPDSKHDRAVLIKIADARASGVDDQPNDDYGSIPAGYTYFGQLVVHDLTHSVAIAGRDKVPFTL